MNEETLQLSHSQKNEFERLQRHADSLAKEKKAHLRRIAQMQTQIKDLQGRILYLETLDQCSSTVLSDVFVTLENKTEHYYSGMKATFDDLLSRTQHLSEALIVRSKERAADILKKANEQLLQSQSDEQIQAPESLDYCEVNNEASLPSPLRKRRKRKRRKRKIKK